MLLGSTLELGGPSLEWTSTATENPSEISTIKQLRLMVTNTCEHLYIQA